MKKNSIGLKSHLLSCQNDFLSSSGITSVAFIMRAIATISHICSKSNKFSTSSNTTIKVHSIMISNNKQISWEIWPRFAFGWVHHSYEREGSLAYSQELDEHLTLQLITIQTHTHTRPRLQIKTCALICLLV
jgi:hypothetical protein